MCCAEDTSGSRDCEFPRSLRGHWYQAGVGDVIITSSLISTKGECFQQYDEYFLIENRYRYIAVITNDYSVFTLRYMYGVHVRRTCIVV